MSGLIRLGARAMFAAKAQLDITAANISNANTPGYSRQSVQLQTAGSVFSGGGFISQGVDVAGISRAYNAFLSREAASTHGQAAAEGARLTQLERLEQLFELGEGGLGQAAGQIFNAFTDVASRPADASARHVLLARVEEFAARMRSTASGLESLQAGVTHELQTSVNAANGLAQRVAELNQQIAKVQGLGHPPNDLLDRREQFIKELSAHVQVTQIPAGDGTVGLFLGGGQALVVGAQALELRALPDAQQPGLMRLGTRESGVDRLIPETSLTGGSIAGLLRFQSHDLSEVQNQLGRLAVVMSDALNRQQAAGLDLEGRPGAPLLAAGAPRVLPSLHNQGTASVTLGIEDSALLQASDYELVREGKAYRLTRLSDGVVVAQANVPSPSTGSSSGSMSLEVDGLQLQISGDAQSGDRFLLQPLRQAGSGLQRQMDNPQGIAAASPTSSNGNALLEAPLVGQRLVNGQLQGGMSIIDVYANLVSDIGVRVQIGRTTAAVSRAAAQDAEAARSNEAGVNLDEEAARLIQYQQAYQAAAKVLQVAQTVFDTLLQTAAR